MTKENKKKWNRIFFNLTQNIIMSLYFNNDKVSFIYYKYGKKGLIEYTNKWTDEAYKINKDMSEKDIDDFFNKKIFYLDDD